MLKLNVHIVARWLQPVQLTHKASEEEGKWLKRIAGLHRWIGASKKR